MKYYYTFISVFTGSNKNRNTYSKVAFSCCRNFLRNETFPVLFAEVLCKFRFFKNIYLLQAVKFCINDYLHVETVIQRCSLRKGVLRNFAKFTGKHLCQRWTAANGCFWQTRSFLRIYSRLFKKTKINEKFHFWTVNQTAKILNLIQIL